MTATLNQVFGLTEFRPGQRPALDALINGQDALVIMPTGGGKSLIYQLFAALKPGLTLVISPLIALMKDQVDALAGRLPAAACHSAMDELEQMRILSRASTGKLQLLYISPERALSASFRNLLPRMPVNLLAIDEAHCISQWGHDFRPEYRELGQLRDHLRCPVVALTATATRKVEGDITKVLGLVQPHIERQSFLRPNLSYYIEYPASQKEKQERLLFWLEAQGLRRSTGGKCIIYCATRKTVENLNDFLRAHGFSAGMYHAGKSAMRRDRMQTAYSSSKLPILVATNAFGMGMDQPDVRLVLHYQVPGSVAAYYQESGRAGRDNLPATCVLFYHKADLVTQSFLLGKKGNTPGDGLEDIKAYATVTGCRQKYLCAYFGEDVPACGRCDLCRGDTGSHDFIQDQEILRRQKSAPEYELSEEEIERVRGLLRELPGKFGKRILAAVLRGSRSSDVLKYKLDRSGFYGVMRGVPEESLLAYFAAGIANGSISVVGQKYPKLALSSAMPAGRQRKPGTGGSLKTAATGADGLLRRLKIWRDREARRLKWKKYMVVQNAVLVRIAAEQPQNTTQLAAIKGMGALRAERLGAEILALVRATRT
ncbi:MAG: RecQ family ATP-dependent DNA helicase [Spirochaetales bacterium]|nr:RecQ family ATP-dependent DNA helicase [Spirochaetales bacterium]